MRNEMQSGYVFNLGAGIFGVLFYGKRTDILLRMIDTDSVYDACRILGGQFAGRFVPADSDQAAWGRTIFNVRGSALVLTDTL